ncbi:MAG: anion permease, partial [Aeromonas sp.]
MPINHKIILPLLLSLAILLIPTHWLPLEGITVIEQRVVAIFVLAALCWILEPIPIFATSVLIIVLELLLLSDKGLWFMTADKADPGFGELLKSTEVMATFASPVIMLFLGGFFLAIAATKYHLRIPVKLNSDSGICEHHFRKVCGQGFFEQKLSFEGRHLFDSPNKP